MSSITAARGPLIHCVKQMHSPPGVRYGAGSSDPAPRRTGRHSEPTTGRSYQQRYPAIAGNVRLATLGFDETVLEDPGFDAPRTVRRCGFDCRHHSQRSTARGVSGRMAAGEKGTRAQRCHDGFPRLSGFLQAAFRVHGVPPDKRQDNRRQILRTDSANPDKRALRRARRAVNSSASVSISHSRQNIRLHGIGQTYRRSPRSS